MPVPTRFHWPGRVLLFAALFAICGGHLLLLQTVAWGRMFAVNSRQQPLAAALEKTFDGQHPCALCREVQHERDTGKKPAAAPEIVKLLLHHEAVQTILLPPLDFSQLPPAAPESRVARQERPRLQPPRRFVG